MLIRLRADGAVITDQEFRQLHGNTSFPAQLTPPILDDFGADPVLNGAQPSGQPWEYPVQDGVEEINGQWYTKFILGPTFSSPEEEAEYIANWQTQQGLARAPEPKLVASGVFTVTGTWPDTFIESLGAASGIAMVFAIDAGQYWVFFNEPQEDLSFAVYASASGGQINITSRTLDYIELCIKDGGVPFDPAEFSVNIVRTL